MTLRFDNSLGKILLLAAAALPLSAQAPSVVIDGPASNSTVSGFVTVSGWALDNTTAPGTSIGSVVVQVDGNTVGAANYGISRPDVCAQYPGRPGCPNVGFAYSLNASSLSVGTHNVTVVATDTDSPPSSSAATVQVVIGPPPMVYIDSPTAGAAVSGTLTVSGWAIDGAAAGATPIALVQVLVDGIPAGTATYGVSRSDVCAQYPGAPNCPNVGFSFSLNTNIYPAGTHTITVTATDSDNAPDTGSASTTVNIVNMPSVMIDSPTAGAVVSGIVSVTGWALDNTTGIAGSIGYVQMLVDDKPVGLANYGVSRSDVCSAYPGRPGCPNVGFLYMLDTRLLSPGFHTVTAVAVDNSVAPNAGIWTTNITVSAPPMVTIESPSANANVSGVITLSGWALDSISTNGSQIGSVQVSVDGAYVGPAIYGLPRMDICDIYAGRPGCPNVGFTFYNLDTTKLAPGPHTITVTATDTDASPDTGSTSVTVNVSPNYAFNLETPVGGAVVSGTVAVSGWAIAPMGSVLNAITVNIDGTPVGTATYGQPRTDACAVFPGAGCPNVGFTYQLDTSTLSTGAHLLTVTATSNGGATTVGSGNATITVTR